ncbi:hypothetical protein WA158_001447 [Blastocystis sp. Blastoise]
MDLKKTVLDIGNISFLKNYMNLYEFMINEEIKNLKRLNMLGNYLNDLFKVLGGVDNTNSVEKNMNQLFMSLLCSKQDIFCNMNLLENERIDDDSDIDYICFTNDGPFFPISKEILDSIQGSYIDECCAEDRRTEDGIIFLDYCGNDALTYLLIDNLNGKEIDVDSLSYKQQIELLYLFEFCEIPIPQELFLIRERRDTKKKKYKEGDEVELIINRNKNTMIKDYLIKNELWNEYVMSYDNGFVDYNHIEDSLYINKNYEYIDYITQYINNGTIDIKDEDYYQIDIIKVENEMNELFGDKGKEEIRMIMIQRSFKGSYILNIDYNIPLVNWFGNEKKWKLLYRASEHNYSSKEFHKYCDNQGETVTIIKHIGHNNRINIFGGYTNQSWETINSHCWKPYSKEFLFTLSNEHDIPPTKYDYIDNNKDYGIYCNIQYGPTFMGNDLLLYDECHTIPSSSCNIHYSSVLNTPQKNSLFVNTNNSETKNHFKVDDYEVWKRI